MRGCRDLTRLFLEMRGILSYVALETGERRCDGERIVGAYSCSMVFARAQPREKQRNVSHEIRRVSRRP